MDDVKGQPLDGVRGSEQVLPLELLRLYEVEQLLKEMHPLVKGYLLEDGNGSE